MTDTERAAARTFLGSIAWVNEDDVDAAADLVGCTMLLRYFENIVTGIGEALNSLRQRLSSFIVNLQFALYGLNEFYNRNYITSTGRC